MKTKVCRICGGEKSIDEFPKNSTYFKKGTKDGKHIYCKKCCLDRTNKWKLNRKPCLKAKLPREVVTTQRVLKAIRKGKHSREAIRKATKRTMNEVVNVLANLWDQKRLRIIKKGEEAEFHLAA